MDLARASVLIEDAINSGHERFKALLKNKYFSLGSLNTFYLKRSLQGDICARTEA
jgi:hypothetical protein